MKEHYPAVKASMAESRKDIQSKEVVTTVANSWKAMSDIDKEAWKERAKALADDEVDDAVPDDALAHAHVEAADIEEEGV